MKIGKILSALLLVSLLITLHISSSGIFFGGVISSAGQSTEQTFSVGSAEIIQYRLPSGASQPWDIVSDRSTGLLWFVEQSSNQIGSFNPATSSFSEYPIPTAHALPESLAVDSSAHRVWITELQSNQIGELIQKNGTMFEYVIPKGPENVGCGPIGISVDSNGNVWFTCEFSNQIDEFFPSNSSFLEFNLPVFYSAPLQIVFDPTGNFWFTAADADMLGYATVAQLQNGTTKGIQEFSPVNQSFVTTISDPQQPSGKLVASLSTPSGLAISADGKTLWITEHTASTFDKYEIQSKTLVKYWTSQTHNENYSESLPNGIALDSNGTVWIAEHYGNKILEFNPVTERMTEYSIPCCGTEIAGSLYLAIGPNNTVWFTEFYGNAIGELKPNISSNKVSLSSDAASYSMASNGNLSVPLEVMVAGNTTGPLNLDVSGLTSSGTLENLSAIFSQSVVSGTGNHSISLNFRSSGLESGIHYLTVSAIDSKNNVTYSMILKVDVGDSVAQFKYNILEAALIGVVVSVAVVFVILVGVRNRKSKSRQLRRSSRKKR